MNRKNVLPHMVSQPLEERILALAAKLAVDHEARGFVHGHKCLVTEEDAWNADAGLGRNRQSGRLRRIGSSTLFGVVMVGRLR